MDGEADFIDRETRETEQPRLTDVAAGVGLLDAGLF